MNTYEITFKRENGTTGSERFTAATEAEARRDFKNVYRHCNGHITKVELINSNSAATKEQERKALEKIKKIVESLGEDSYIGAVFEGCFEDAEANIENDWSLSMKSRWMDADRKLNEANGTIKGLRDELAESEKDYEAAHATAHLIADEKEAEITALKSRLLADDDLADISHLLTKTVADLESKVGNAAELIVEVADQPESAAFRNAVEDHRAAKAVLSRRTALLTRVDGARRRA